MAKVRITGTPSAAQSSKLVELVMQYSLDLSAQDCALTLGGRFSDDVWVALLGLQHGGLYVEPVDGYTIPLSLMSWNIHHLSSLNPPPMQRSTLADDEMYNNPNKGRMGML